MYLKVNNFIKKTPSSENRTHIMCMYISMRNLKNFAIIFKACSILKTAHF